MQPDDIIEAQNPARTHVSVSANDEEQFQQAKWRELLVRPPS